MFTRDACGFSVFSRKPSQPAISLFTGVAIRRNSFQSAYTAGHLSIARTRCISALSVLDCVDNMFTVTKDGFWLCSRTSITKVMREPNSRPEQTSRNIEFFWAE
jgi:hypothetical protein